jgi:hypothetical protein
MTSGDREAFMVLMLGLGETYGEPVSDVRMEIYFHALVDLALNDVRTAANRHVRWQKFFPRPSELREAVQGSTEDRAELAWMNVLQLVRHVGYMGQPVWSDRAQERAALELYGSWRNLCDNLPNAGPELLGIAKTFKATYAAYSRRAADSHPQLPGRDETHALFVNLREALIKRGLPAPGLPKR